MSIPSERCPYCGEYAFSIINADSDTMPTEITWWWDCECDICHKHFTITAYYQLIGRVITKEGE